MTSGRRYNCVAGDLWRSLRGRSDDARMLAVYLLTNSHTRVGGLYVLPLDYAAVDLSWPVKRVREALDELTAAGAIVREDASELVFITDWHRHDLLANPSAALAAVRLVLGEHRMAPDSPPAQAAARALVPEVERVLKAATADGRQRATLLQLLPDLKSAAGHRVDTVPTACGHGEDTSGRVGSGRPGVGSDVRVFDESRKKGERSAKRDRALSLPHRDDDATRAQLDMLAGKATKRGRRLPDICSELNIPTPIAKGSVDPILSYLEGVPVLPVEERAARSALTEAPIAWKAIEERLDAGDPCEAQRLLREASPQLRDRLKGTVAEYLNRGGSLLDAMCAVGATHDTLGRDLLLVWAELQRRGYGQQEALAKASGMPE